LDVSGIITGSSDYDDAADSIRNLIAEIADGKLTRAEEWQEGQIIVPVSQMPL
jgi:altronate dehydratase